MDLTIRFLLKQGKNRFQFTAKQLTDAIPLTNYESKNSINNNMTIDGQMYSKGLEQQLVFST